MILMILIVSLLTFKKLKKQTYRNCFLINFGKLVNEKGSRFKSYS